MNDFVQIAEKLASAGAATGLILVLYGGYRGWWVYGRQLAEERTAFETTLAALRLERDALRQERNEYKALLFRTLRVTETAVEVAKTTTPPAP
jgi:hypothetical protein